MPKENKRVCLVTTLFLILSLIVPSNKIFFVTSSLYIGTLFLVTRSAAKTYLYSFFVLHIFSIGQIYAYQVIPPEKLQLNSLYPEGRSLFFIFTPLLAVTMAASFSLFGEIFRTTKIHAIALIPSSIYGYLIFFLLSLISSSKSDILPSLSMLYVLTDIFLLGWTILTILLLSRLPKPKKNVVIATILILLVLVLLFETGVILLQFLRRDLVGLHIEGRKDVPYFGLGADENPLQFRPMGFSMHPNILTIRVIGEFFSIALLLSYIYENMKHKTLIVLGTVGLFVSALILVFTQTRSAYTGLTLAIGFIALRHYGIIKKWVIEAMNRLSSVKVLIIPLVVISTVIVSDRLLYASLIFTETGGISTRMQLAEEAIVLINKYFIWGVGKGMFIPAAFNQHYLEQYSESIITYFPEAVHNGFLLILSENGILAGIGYVFLIVLLLRDILKAHVSQLTRSIVFGSLMSFFTLMLLQPYILLLPLSVIIFFILSASTYGNKTA